MKSEDLEQLGVPSDDAMKQAHELMIAFRTGKGVSAEWR